MNSPLELYDGVVEPGWVDANGHMMDGYYAVAFGLASWNVQDALGMDADYRARTGCTLYTAEAHIVYLSELKEAQAIRIQTQLLGVDTKRIRIFHRMLDAAGGNDAATMELMVLHFDQRAGATAVFPDDLRASLAAIADDHATLPMPSQAGRSVRAIGG